MQFLHEAVVAKIIEPLFDLHRVGVFSVDGYAAPYVDEHPTRTRLGTHVSVVRLAALATDDVRRLANGNQPVGVRAAKPVTRSHERDQAECAEHGGRTQQTR